MYKDEKNIKSFILFLFNDIGKSEIGKELLKLCKSADEPSKDLRKARHKMFEIQTSSKVENKDYYRHIEVITSK